VIAGAAFLAIFIFAARFALIFPLLTWMFNSLLFFFLPHSNCKKSRAAGYEPV
jgi:hypothetical protein